MKLLDIKLEDKQFAALEASNTAVDQMLSELALELSTIDLPHRSVIILWALRFKFISTKF